MKVLTTIFTFIILNNCLAQSNYCIPVPPDSVDGHSVSMVRLQSLDTSFTGPYYQFIRDSVHHETCFLKPGSTYKIHLKSGTHSVSTLGAWIDWNNDTTLSSTEKLGEFTTSSVNERDSISFTVPLNSAKGKLRLRVRASNSSTLNACNPNLSGQTIDFTITILNPAYDTDFYPGWRFSNTGNSYIDGIKIGTIDNQHSGAPTGPVYHDYSYMTTNITACISNNIYITGKFSSNDDSVYAYIDFNKNGIFEVLELIANSSFTAGQHTDSVQFSTPSVSGICRLRIEYVSSSGIIEVEDYSVNIVNTSILNFPQAIIGSDLLFDCNNGCYFYGCSGPITFYDYGCGKPTLRYWSVPGASPSTSTLQNPTFNFPSSGIYNITLKDSNSIGSDIFTSQVYITAPVINFNLGTNTTVCTGDSLLLTAPSGDPIIDCYSYVWSTGATTREIYVRNSGTYSVILSTCHSGECPAYDTIDVNFSPAIYNVTGGGSYCIGSNGSEVRLSDSQTGILYQLYNNNNPVGSAVAGTGSLISFGLHTTSGTYTIRATNSVISCTKTMSGFVNINAVTPPDIYTVTGGGGYCAGGSGIAVGLINSDVNVSYQLYRDTSLSGAPVIGTGATFFFPNHATPGSYTVVATTINSSCTASMTGSANIIVYPAPSIFNVTGGGTYCGGSPQSKLILDNSNIGDVYELIRNSIPTGIMQIGTDSAITFSHILHPGTYTVVAYDTSSCVSTMTGNAVINIISTPFQFTLTGPGTQCDAQPVDSIFLSGSENWVRYQLYLDGNPVGNSLNGFGDPLNFGLHTASGTYTVVGSNSITACHLPMDGSPTLMYYNSPIKYTVTGGGQFCAGSVGVPVGLSWSDIPNTYQLYLDGSPVGIPLQGMNTALNFGIRTAGGIYTIIASGIDSACSTLMIDSAIIIVNPLPLLSIINNFSDTVCTFDPPFVLNGTPAGGTFSGDGVLNNTFYPSQTSLEIVELYYDYTDSSTGCSSYIVDSVFVEVCNEIDEFNFSSSFILYPNPADKNITCELSTKRNINFSMEISNVTGEILWQYKQNNLNGFFSKIIDTSTLSEGLYFVKFIINKNILIKMFLILHQK